MQRGLVDLCLVGTDRTSAAGDVANKIGTYLKALAARDNNVPFYVALPSTTIDWEVSDGLAEIPIEQRPAEELTRVWGRTRRGELTEVEIAPPGCPARNDAFDVTPARLVTALVTERGVCAASAAGLRSLFPEPPVQEGGGVG
jgi:methylthioribose-1-phosphate isomerase